jgi:hypothetical protein
MESLSDRLKEYQTNCRENRWGGIDNDCRLTDSQLVEIKDLIQYAIWYRNGVLSKKLKIELFEKLDSSEHEMSSEQLIDLLCALD